MNSDNLPTHVVNEKVINGSQHMELKVLKMLASHKAERINRGLQHMRWEELMRTYSKWD